MFGTTSQLVQLTSWFLPHEAKDILGAALYCPLSEKTCRLLTSVYTESDTRLFGFVMGENVVAVMGIRLDSRSGAQIPHMMVDEGNRRNGYGRQLVELVVQEEALTGLCAKTDRDAVGFYQRCVFSVESLGEKYPGIKRLRCSWVKGENGGNE